MSLFRIVIAIGMLSAAARAFAADAALVQKTEDGAGTAMRVALYGIDNEMPDKDDLTMAKFLMKKVQTCLDGVTALRKTDPALKLELNGQEPMSLDDVENKFCKPAMAAVAPRAKGAVDIDEAKYQGLSPERIEALKTYNLRQYTIFGTGQRKLVSNADLQKANVWYVWDYDKTYLTPAWWMATIRFNGGKYERTVSKGAGSAPPASAFR